jgi:hypothetical protein
MKSQKQDKKDKYLIVRISPVQQKQLKEIKKRTKTSVANLVRNYLEYQYLNVSDNTGKLIKI